MSALMKFLIFSTIIFNTVWTFETSECKQIIGQLAASNSHYLQCVTNNGVPVGICINCVDEYKQVETDYEHFLKGNDSNLSCSEIYVDKDKLNIIAHTHEIIKNLWAEAYCSNCYNPDGTTTNLTAKFNLYSINYDACQLRPVDLCTECKSEYADLNKIYNELEEIYKNQICFDLQDKMNRTRGNWTAYCGHDTPKASLVAFAAANSALTLIPVLFYVGFYIFKRIQERSHEILDLSTEIDPRNNLPTTTQVSPNIPTTSGGIAANDVRASTSTSKLINTDDDDDINLLL